MFFVKFIFLICLNISAVLGAEPKKNVCPTWQGYWTIDENSECYYNSDQDLELPEISNKYGYPLIVDNVTTVDGYILKLFRIKSNGKTVVLTPGIYSSPLTWFTIGNNSLPFVLSRQGYDVWVVSFRGTRYGNQNLNYSFDDDRFWEFGLHELGTKDLPAIIEFIYQETGNKKIIFLGFSMGTSTGLIYCSTFPTECQKYLERLVNMAVIMHLQKTRSILSLLQHFWDLARPFVHNNIFQPSPSTREIQENLFLRTPIHMEVYKFIMGLIFGFDRKQFNPSTLPVTVVQNGDAVCKFIIDNYVQIMRSGKFKALDYHSNEKNIAHYGSPNVPVYNISKILVPYTLIYGQNDALSTPENTLKLFSELPGTANCLFKIPYLKFNHQDYPIAKNSYDFLYKHLAEEWLEASC